MTIQDVLALYDRQMEEAWRELREALVHACSMACLRAEIDPREADDMAQEGIVRTARDGFAALRNLDGKVLLSSWASGVARNLIRERLREKQWHGVVEAVESEGHPESTTDSAVEGSEALHLAALTDKERAAIRERIEGRPEREAGLRLGISRSTFRDRVRRATKRLMRVHGALPQLPEISRGWAEGLLDAGASWLR